MRQSYVCENYWGVTNRGNVTITGVELIAGSLVPDFYDKIKIVNCKKINKKTKKISTEQKFHVGLKSCNDMIALYKYLRQNVFINLSIAIVLGVFRSGFSLGGCTASNIYRSTD